jgi:hypothetical protein
LITPMNDSLLDFDVLGSVDPTTPEWRIMQLWFGRQGAGAGSSTVRISTGS